MRDVYRACYAVSWGQSVDLGLPPFCPIVSEMASSNSSIKPQSVRVSPGVEIRSKPSLIQHTLQKV